MESSRPSLTAADLAWIEAQMHVTLPAVYQHTLLAPASDGPGPPDQDAIWRDVHQIVRANQAIRRAWTAFWPASYFIIGQDDVGGLYVLDLDQARSPVLSLPSGVCEDVQQIVAEEVAPSVAAWDALNR